MQRFISSSRNNDNLNSVFITLTPLRCFNLLRALIICALSIAAKLTHCRRVEGAQKQAVCLLVPCQNADVTRNSRFYVCGVYIKGLLSISRLARARRASAPPLLFVLRFFLLFSTDLSLFCYIVLANADVLKHRSTGQMRLTYSENNALS